MEETQVWGLLATQIIGISIFFAGNAFLIWVAFRVSKSINETGGNVLFKIVGTVFGLGIVWNGLGLGGFLNFVNQAAAYSLGQLKASGIELSAMGEGFVAMVGSDAPVYSLMPDLIGGVWWLSVLAIILLPIWGPKTSN